MSIEDSKLKKITIISLVIIVFAVFVVTIFDAWRERQILKSKTATDIDQQKKENNNHPLSQDEIKQAAREATLEEKTQMKVLTQEEIQLAGKKKANEEKDQGESSSEIILTR